MVCSNEGSAQCIVNNLVPDATKKRATLIVRPSYTISILFEQIKNQLDVDKFDILMQTSKTSEEIRFNESDNNKTLADIGIDFSSGQNRTTIKLVPVDSSNEMTQDGEIETYTMKARRSAIVSTAEADSAAVPNPLDGDEHQNESESMKLVDDSNYPIPLFGVSKEFETKTYYPSRCKY